jgi:hypothetical protein
LTNTVGTRGGSGTPAQWSVRGDQVGGAAMAFTGLGGVGSCRLDFGTIPGGWQDLAVTGQPSTLMARIFFDGSNLAGIARRNDGNTVSPGWEWGVQNNPTARHLQMVLERSSVNIVAECSVETPQNQWITVATSWNGGLSGGNIQFYIDGVNVGGSTVSAGSGVSGSDAAQTLYVGETNFNPLGGSFGGSISWIAAFKRQLADAEVADWGVSARPWTRFARMPFVYAGTGTATTAMFSPFTVGFNA